MKRILGIAMMLGLLGAVTLIAGCSKENSPQTKKEPVTEKVGFAPKEETPTEKVGSTPKKIDKAGEPAAQEVADFSDNIFTVTLKSGLKKIELEMVLVPAGKFKMGFTKKELEDIKVVRVEDYKSKLAFWGKAMEEHKKREKKEPKIKDREKEERGKKEVSKEYREKEEKNEMDDRAKQDKELGESFKENFEFFEKKLNALDQISDQGKQYEVTLTKPFYMGKYEITQEQWEAVMGNNPSKTAGAKLPVTNVSWNDCQDFIKKLNAKTNGGYKLPLEAEWEYACRAGTTTAYSFGDSLTKSDANIDERAAGSIKAVGSYKPNAFGLNDMHGNVFEWCEDWHGDYPAGPVTNPTGATTGKDRVFRGGSFLESMNLFARSSYRSDTSPTDRMDFVGFRLVRTK